MTGHSESVILGDPISWLEATLKHIETDYEEVRISLIEASGHKKLVRCVGYISLELPVFWDEVLIERAAVYSEHPIIADRCARIPATTGGKWCPSGSPVRNEPTKQLLEVRLIDGCVLSVCATRFICESIA